MLGMSGKEARMLGHQAREETSACSLQSFDSGMGTPGPSLHSLPAGKVLQNAPPLNECRTSKGTFQGLLRSVGLTQFSCMLRVCGLIGAEILMNKAVLS